MSSVLRALHPLLLIPATLSACATLIGLGFDGGWPLGLLSLGRLHYIPLLALALCLPPRRPRQPHRLRWSPLQFFWAIALGINLVWILPLAFPFTIPSFSLANAALVSSPLSPHSQPHPLKLQQITLEYSASDLEPTITAIEQTQADLISMLELFPNDLDRLKQRLPDYQLITFRQDPSSNSAAFWVHKPALSRFTRLTPFTIQLPDLFGSLKVPAQLLTYRASLGLSIQMPDRPPLQIIQFQPSRPVTRPSYDYQAREFQSLADWSQTQQQQGKEVIVIGDFNQAPWTYRFQQLQHQGQLRNSMQGQGITSTWNMRWPWPLRLPLDHVLHSAAWVTIARGHSPQTDSDHAPIWVELAHRT